MKHFLLIVISLLTGAYLLLNYTGHSYPQSRFEPIEFQISSNPLSSQYTRKIIAVQARMENNDYSSEAHFKHKIESYFIALEQKGLRLDSSLVVFPEHIGTWLVAVDEHKWVTGTNKMNMAMALLAYARFPLVLKKYFGSPDGISDPLVYAIFYAKAKKMQLIYRQTFSEMAKKYKVYIVAGSIVLPEAKSIIDSSSFSKTLYNSSFLFHPDGACDPSVTHKVFPINSESGFTSSGDSELLPVYDLSFGRTSILICADSWSTAVYEHIAEQGTEIILVPSFASGDQSMSQKWKGFNGQANSPDLNPQDIDSITEAEAWTKYALNSQISSTAAKLGLNVFLRGQLWDLGSDGNSWILEVKTGKRLTSTSGNSEIIVFEMPMNDEHYGLAEVQESKNIRLDLRYATENNFTQTQIYSCGRCFLSIDLAQKISSIAEELAEKHQLKLKLFDCYRPKKYQEWLWEIVPDARYVTPPSRGSMHGRGLAIDLTITDQNNVELDMGSAYDYFGLASHTDHDQFAEEVRKNRALLNALMNKHGLVGIRTEWWHYFLPAESEVLDWEWRCP